VIKKRAISLLLMLMALAATPVLIVLVAVWGLFFIGSPPPGCDERKVLSKAVSPDGAWVATVYNNICSDGVFVTVVSDTVEITRPDEQAAPIPAAGVVFGMSDHPSYGDKALSVKWIAERSLEITVPNDTWAGPQDSSYADLAISYKYVPDDPVERSCLKQWRASPTDVMVHRTLSPTDDINAFLARCHAAGAPH
jgi:hypothetical protein